MEPGRIELPVPEGAWVTARWGPCPIDSETTEAALVFTGAAS